MILSTCGNRSASVRRIPKYHGVKTHSHVSQVKRTTMHTHIILLGNSKEQPLGIAEKGAAALRNVNSVDDTLS